MFYLAAGLARRVLDLGADNRHQGVPMDSPTNAQIKIPNALGKPSG